IFINQILGLMSPSSTHPCPICIINKNNLLATAPYRTINDNHSIHQNHDRLLSISSDRIVPMPLHVYLGICNRIISDVLKDISGISDIKTIHTTEHGGASDFFDLNGHEIDKYIKHHAKSSNPLII